PLSGPCRVHRAVPRHSIAALHRCRQRQSARPVGGSGRRLEPKWTGSMELPVRPERMNRSAYVYVALTTVAAFALAAVLPWDQVVNLAWADLVGLASFIAVAILSEAMAIDFAVGANRAAKSSIAFLPLFAAAALFPPIAALFAAAAV